MAKRVAVVIAEDPRQSPRPVEALRIALGLSAGEHETTVVLLGESSRLLSDEIDDVMDVEILEKYRPSFQHMNVPFILEQESGSHEALPGFSVARHSRKEIHSFIRAADRTLIFL
jgi:hypothetical protein